MIDQQHLAEIVERVIHDLLQKERQPKKVMRVIITGDERESLLNTLNCMKALDRAGYGLVVTLSHSASRSEIESVLIRWQQEGDVPFVLEHGDHGVSCANEDYYGLFLPALSTNSLSKIALCLRDNIATQWVFEALIHKKPITATLSQQCQSLIDIGPLALRKQLLGYVAQVENYGVSFIGSSIDRQHQNPRIITLKEIRHHQEGEVLWVDKETLITPSARDEIARLNLTVKRIN